MDNCPCYGQLSIEFYGPQDSKLVLTKVGSQAGLQEAKQKHQAVFYEELFMVKTVPLRL